MLDSMACLFKTKFRQGGFTSPLFRFILAASLLSSLFLPPLPLCAFEDPGPISNSPVLAAYIPVFLYPNLTIRELIPPQPAEPETARTKATLMAVGDIMMHSQNIRAGYDPQTMRYDFSSYFEYVALIFKEADWVIGNLETRLAGKKARYAGYPMFNAPDILAVNLREAGFDLLTTANNHCLDRRAQGIIQTNQVLDEAGLRYTGSFSSQADRDTIRILKKGDIRIAVLAYTYGTNGIPIPKDRPYMVNLIDLEVMKKDINRAKDLGVDFIICSLHFGYEYQRLPSRQQKYIVDQLLDQGVDIILGHHPHVVQPYEVREDGNNRQVIIYSMGNFLANQLRYYTELGVIFRVDLEKDPRAGKRILNVEALPTKIVKHVKNGRRTFSILPLEKILLARPKDLFPDYLYPHLERDLAQMNNHLKRMHKKKKKRLANRPSSLIATAAH